MDEHNATVEGNFTVTLTNVFEDLDGDGFTNATELAYGSDPRDANSVANAPPADLNSTAPLTVPENQPIGTIVGEFNATDPDANFTLSYQFKNGENNNSLFSLDPNGSLSTAVEFDYENNDTHLIVEVEVFDNHNASSIGTFDVVISNVNEAPVIANGTSFTLTLDEDGNLSDSTLVATDPDAGDLLTWSYVFFGDRNETILLDGNGTSPNFQYLPIPNFHGSENLLARVTDALGLYDECNVTLVVNPVDDPPIIVFAGGEENGTVNIAENQRTVGTVGVTEADGDLYTYEITGGEDASSFYIDSNSGELNFVNAPDFENPSDANRDQVYEVTIFVSDTNGNTDFQNLYISVENMVDLSTFIFSNAGSVGTSGPLAGSLASAYYGTDLEDKVTMTEQGIQEIEIPFSGEFLIEAMGAQGGKGRSGSSSGGLGARMGGHFYLLEGEKIFVVVGQMGADSSRGGSGGGGSFVWRQWPNGDRELLVAAGGGGGGADGSYYNTQIDGRVENSGGDSVGQGGENGEDGNLGGTHTSYAGRGWNGYNFEGQGTGGFGGGGGGDNHASGGGGGYSGGGSSSCGSKSGGGGGSYNIGTNQENIGGVNEGHGKVIISALNTPPSDLLLSNDYMPENQAIGTRVGQFFTIDPDDANQTGTYRYELVSGEGAESNARFTLTEGGVLKTATSFDYEIDPMTFSIRVRTSDEFNASMESSFLIFLLDETTLVVDTMLPEKAVDGGVIVGVRVLNDAKVYELGVLLAGRPISNPNQDGVVRVPVLTAGQGSLSSQVYLPGFMQGVYEQWFLPDPEWSTLYAVAYGINVEGETYGLEEVFDLDKKASRYDPLTAAQAMDNAPGWWESPWLGNYYRSESGWMLHLDLGWLYPSPSAGGGLWMWKEAVGWIWTEDGLYPYLYSAGRENWLYFFGEHEKSRLLYDYGERNWMNLNERSVDEKEEAR